MCSSSAIEVSISCGGSRTPTGAKELFDEAARIATTSTASWGDAYLIVYWASMARPEEARRLGAGVDLERLPGIISAAAAWALVVAHGDAGHVTEANRTAEVGDAYAQHTGTAAHMRLLIVDRHVGALMQSGRIGEANSLAEQARQQTVDVPGVAQLISTAIAGRVAAGSGHLGEASSLLETVVELFAGDSNGFRYRYLVPLATTLAMRGLTAEASWALSAAEAEHHRSYGFVAYERDLAHAWVVPARQGAVSEAINIARAAAETTRANGQFAAEVVCLQTATQFGDGSTAPRLRELAAIVEGPRVDVALRFAAALAAGDGSELTAVSDEFEEMGDLVAALDAAAHAATAYRQRDLRGSALGCSTRADALAERCGGAADARASSSRQAHFTDLAGTRNRDVVGRGVVQPCGCRTPDSVGTHHRGPHLPGDDKDRCVEPRGTRGLAESGSADRS